MYAQKKSLGTRYSANVKNMESSSICLETGLIPERPYKTSASGTFVLARRSSAVISLGVFSVLKS